jgi:hypothetical protein
MLQGTAQHKRTWSSRCFNESFNALSSCMDCCGLPDKLLHPLPSSSLSTALCRTLTVACALPKSLSAAVDALAAAMAGC